ncbi:MAG: oligosaccharide flippase family protein [Acidobacteriia bacterium]|nr:oligosaccharide flippase family protein [Terriglobia bacterium]
MADNKGHVFRHFVVYGLGIVLMNAAGFLLIPLYARYLSTAEFGILEIIGRCVEISTIIFALWLGMTSLSFYSKETDEDRKNTAISTGLIPLLALSICSVIIFLALARPINHYFFGNDRYLYLFRMAGVIMFAELSSSVPMAYLQARMASGFYIGISLARLLSTLVLTIVAVVVLNMRLKGVILSNMIVGLSFAFILVGYTLYKTGHKFDWPMYKKMLTFGLPFVPGALFLFMLNNGDRFFIQRMLDSSSVGVYSLGYKLGTVGGTFVLGPFIKVWGPYMFKLDRDSEDRNAFGRYFLFLILAYCLVSLPLALFSREIIRIIAAPGYWEAYKIVPWSLVAYLFWTAAIFPDSAFYITGKTIYKPLVMGAAAALIFLLYWLLIPVYGIMGGAYATLICFAVYLGLTWFFAHRIYPVKYPLGKFAYVLGLGIALYLIGITFLAGLSLWLQVVLKCVLALVYPGLIVASRVLDKGDLQTARLYIVTMWGKITRTSDAVPTS